MKMRKPTYMDYRRAYLVLDGSAEEGCEIVHTCLTEESAKKYMEENKPESRYEVLRRHELGSDYTIVGIRSRKGTKLRIKRRKKGAERKRSSRSPVKVPIGKR